MSDNGKYAAVAPTFDAMRQLAEAEITSVSLTLNVDRGTLTVTLKNHRGETVTLTQNHGGERSAVDGVSTIAHETASKFFGNFLMPH